MIPPDLTFEQHLWTSYSSIAGLDEAGRGALAGPVCVASVILPPNAPHLTRTLAGVRDSKQIPPSERERLAPLIRETSLAWGIGFASAEEIDRLGIVRATRLAAERALQAMPISPDYLLTDFRLDLPEIPLPQTALVKGDQRSLSIAAASILAKTSRDALMNELDRAYPGYGLGKHKGYGTQAHRLALQRLGYSPIHRQSFIVKKQATPEV